MEKYEIKSEADKHVLSVIEAHLGECGVEAVTLMLDNAFLRGQTQALSEILEAK